VNLGAHEGKEVPVSHRWWTPNDDNNTDAYGTIFIFKQKSQKSWWIWLDLNETFVEIEHYSTIKPLLGLNTTVQYNKTFVEIEHYSTVQ